MSFRGFEVHVKWWWQHCLGSCIFFVYLAVKFGVDLDDSPHGQKYPRCQIVYIYIYRYYTYLRDSFSSSLAMQAPEHFSASSSFREVTRGFTSILSEPLEMVQMILTYL